MRIVGIEVDGIDLYCNRHAKSKPADIIYILFFEHAGMHIFLCNGAHFSVQKRAIILDHGQQMCFLTG